MWDWKWTADFLTHWNHLFLICQNGKIYYLNYNTVWRKWQQKDKGREWGSLCLFFLSLPTLWFWLLLFGGLLLVTLWLRDGSIDLWQLRAIDTSEGYDPITHDIYICSFQTAKLYLWGVAPRPTLAMLQDTDFTIMSPISYFGNRRSGKMPGFCMGEQDDQRNSGRNRCF